MRKSIFLISLPRSLSTAFERSMIELGELNVLHEPWCIYYYVGLGYDIPAKFLPDFIDEFDKFQFFDELLKRAKKEKLFIKDFAYTIRPILESKSHGNFDPSLVEFTFLFRDPFECVISFYKICQATEPQTLDKLEQQINYKQFYETYCLCRKLLNKKPFIIEAETLKQDPEQTMLAYCNYVGIKFDPKMLHWENKEFPAGWEVAKAWHEETMQSTGFSATPTSTMAYYKGLPREEQLKLDEFVEKQRPFYQLLQQEVDYSLLKSASTDNDLELSNEAEAASLSM